MTRRRLLLGAASALAALRGSRLAAAGAPAWRLIQRVARPPELETPPEALDMWLTPIDAFFVRSHFDPAVPGLFPQRLSIEGPSGSGLELSAKDLEGMSTVEIPAVLQCAGNGRALFPARVPGVQWRRGAVGNAMWRGVPLAHLLDRAGLTRAGKHVRLFGGDVPPHPHTPQYRRSIPMERALDSRVLVAFAMNGQPLPALHGGPMRLVVPGWAGNHWFKWLTRIEVGDAATGPYMDPAYQMPRAPGSSDYAPLTTLPIKSWITYPLSGASYPPTPMDIRGNAISGSHPVKHVEVSTDGGRSWVQAQVDPLSSPGAWQRWTVNWRPPRPGRHTLVARATDQGGAVQPEITPPNRSGYFWNGWDRVECEVMA